MHVDLEGMVVHQGRHTEEMFIDIKKDLYKYLSGSGS